MRSPLLVVIPAYNEEKNIQYVVEDLKKNCPQYDYLIVNDLSLIHITEPTRRS